MQPAMLVVKTNAAKMICQSPYKYQQTMKSDPTDGNGSNALGKRRGIFQDDSAEDQSIW